MAATCAGCKQPIVSGEDFRLSGTEAFHATCVHLIAESVGTKRHLALIEANRQLLCERERVRCLESDLEATRIDCNRKNQRIAALERSRADSETARETIRMLTEELANVRERRDLLAQDYRRASHLLLKADADLESAREEIAALRSAAAPAAAATVEPSDNDDDYGGAGARFKLLELD